MTSPDPLTYAAETLNDPTLSPETLAHIAQHRPDLRAAVASSAAKNLRNATTAEYAKVKGSKDVAAWIPLAIPALGLLGLISLSCRLSPSRWTSWAIVAANRSRCFPKG